MILNFILLTSCCLLLLLETVILEHAKWLKIFEKASVLEKQGLNDSDISVGWGYKEEPVYTPVLIPNLKKEVAPVVYEESNLTQEHEDFFKALSKMVELEPEEEPVAIHEPSPFEMEHFELAEPPVQEFSNEVQEELEEPKNYEYLSMDDWEEKPIPVNVDSQLSATASHKIKDDYIGEQLWVVEVIGYEQTYIHVSDGDSRAWLNINRFKNIHQGDILSVLVDRDITDQLFVLDVDILQKKSNDFAIDIEEEVDYQVTDYDYAM